MDTKFLYSNLKIDTSGFYYSEKLIEKPKKYLLINPSIVDTKELVFMDFCNVPTGLLRIANLLICQGHKVKYYDFEAYSRRRERTQVVLSSKKKLFMYGKSISDFYVQLQNMPRLDEVFISCTMTYHYPHLKQLVDTIKKVDGKVKITVGGVYANLCSSYLKKLGINVHVGPYHNADIFRPLMEITNQREYAVLRLVKGCPHKCSYCAVPKIEGNKIYKFPKETVIEQFQEFYSLGFRKFMFWDSNLLFAKELLFELMDFIIDYGYSKSVKLNFSYGLEFNLIDDELIDKLKRIKLDGPIFVPLESSDYNLYRNRFHKQKNHLDSIRHNVLKLCDNGICDLGFYVLVGLPSQTLDQVLSTIIFGMQLKLNPFIMIFTPIPCTEEFRRYKKLFKDKEYWQLNPNLYPCESKELTSKDIKDIYYTFHGGVILSYSKKTGLVISSKYFRNMVNVKSDERRAIKRFGELFCPEQIR